MSDYVVRPSASFRGRIDLPGDKSISHRSVLFGAIAHGTTRVHNLLEGEDVLATVASFRNMGIVIRKKGRVWEIAGKGLGGLRSPEAILDCGNSGTTMRLMLGLLAGSGVTATLTGDASLNARPMGRVIDPLRSMGATIFEMTETRSTLGENIRLIEVRGGGIRGGAFKIPMASAQVKSALLLAGLMAGRKVSVTEPLKSRDHTERMLKAFGARVKVKGLTVTVEPVERLKAQQVFVPGDFSSAAFFLVLGLIGAGKGRLVVRNIGLNPTRVGALEILKKMGGRIRVLRKKTVCGETVGDLEARPSRLKAVTIGGGLIPRLIDEIPILSVAAAAAEGRTVIRDAGELRVKETDRIAALAAELPRFGVSVKERKDGLEVTGSRGTLKAAEGNSYGDHRIAMSLAVLGSIAPGTTRIRETDCVATSFPNFTALMRKVGAKISETQ
ncbi:MAG TPA: 3-phosphoshikimate 1-carboxyvinyltransferase [bacterium]|nr:3-phosphoshikimate 1-carboxyvinyltransferase [bacterium]